MNIQLLVAICIIDNGKILLLKQSNKSPQAGKWAPPAGHVEKNEGPEEAAIRELREETGLSAKLTEIIECALLNVRQKGANKEYLAIFYNAKLDPGQEIKIDGAENIEHAWVGKEEIEKDKYPLRDAFMKPALLKAFGNNFAPLDSFNFYSLDLDASVGK